MRISTTTIESYRNFIENDWLSQDEFIEQLKGKFEATRKMNLGTAFHNILENPVPHFVAKKGLYVSDGFEFQKKDIESATAKVNYAFPFEIKATKVYNIQGIDITVVAKADQLEGRKGNEHKSTWSAFSYDKYAESVQKAIYCDVFELDRVVYKVWEFSDLVSGIRFNGYHEFFFPYSEADIKRALSYLHELVNFIHIHNLESYFQPKAS
jgi:hypothetical protein